MLFGDGGKEIVEKYAELLRTSAVGVRVGKLLLWETKS